MKLFDLRIWTHSGADDLFLFEDGERRFNRGFARRRLFYSESGDPSKENFENGLHVVHKHFLKVSLLLSEVLVLLFLPHFEDNALVYIPVTDVLIEVLKIKTMSNNLP